MRLPDKLVDLLLITLGFAVALGVYLVSFTGGLATSEMLLGTGASILAFWAAIEARSGFGERPLNAWVKFIEQFCLGTGVNLLLHAVLTYAVHVRRTPFLIVAGGVASAALLILRERFTDHRERSKQRFVLIGFDSIAEKIFRVFQDSLIGVIASGPEAVPAGAAYLGGLNSIESVLSEYRPTNVVVSMDHWAENISPALLLNCRLSGVTVQESPAVYETFFSRVCCERLQPVDLLLSSALRGDSRTMAIQAIYTNLIGLALLLVLSPVLIVMVLAAALAPDRGPIFETLECAGFQYIPFRLLRFRTTRLDGTGTVTALGRIILKLHLADLPQLVNVVRGDMALVGPQPVRSEFARYLTTVMPFYSHRFSVKPGILGWAQMHPDGDDQLTDECRQIEYDLFYVKNGSLWMDGEIMLETAMRGARRRSGNS